MNPQPQVAVGRGVPLPRRREGPVFAEWGCGSGAHIPREECECVCVGGGAGGPSIVFLGYTFASREGLGFGLLGEGWKGGSLPNRVTGPVNRVVVYPMGHATSPGICCNYACDGASWYSSSSTTEVLGWDAGGAVGRLGRRATATGRAVGTGGFFRMVGLGAIDGLLVASIFAMYESVREPIDDPEPSRGRITGS